MGTSNSQLQAVLIYARMLWSVHTIYGESDTEDEQPKKASQEAMEPKSHERIRTAQAVVIQATSNHSTTPKQVGSSREADIAGALLILRSPSNSR